MTGSWVRKLGRRERLYAWLARWFDRRAERLGDKAWEKHERMKEE